MRAAGSTMDVVAQGRTGTAEAPVVAGAACPLVSKRVGGMSGEADFSKRLKNGTVVWKYRCTL
jgi:hypothetical protein